MFKRIIILSLVFGSLILTGCSIIGWNRQISLDFKPEKLDKTNQDLNKDCNLDLWSSISVSPKYPRNKFEAEIGVQDDSLNVKLIKNEKNEVYLIGNLGASKLEMISTGNKDISYFYETTFMGNINLFTLFRESNILIMSKQYDVVGAYGTQMIGKCSDIKDSEEIKKIQEEIRNK